MRRQSAVAAAGAPLSLTSPTLAHLPHPPSLLPSPRFGDLSVEMVGLPLTLDHNICVSQLRLTRNEEARAVQHVWYRNWPANGVPSKRGHPDPEPLAAILRAM